MPKFDGLESRQTACEGADVPSARQLCSKPELPLNLLQVHRPVARSFAPDKQTIALVKAEPKIRIALDQPHGFVSRVDLHDPEPPAVPLVRRRAQASSDHDLVAIRRQVVEVCSRVLLPDRLAPLVVVENRYPSHTASRSELHPPEEQRSPPHERDRLSAERRR